jgi:protein tyrosine/serine phosphatase
MVRTIELGTGHTRRLMTTRRRRMMQFKSRRWKFGALAPFTLVVLLGIYVGWVHFSGNFHPVLAGELYRSAQPTPERIAAYKSDYGIATIINLRGANPSRSWYRDEVAASRRLGIKHLDFRMSARHVLAQEKAAELISIMKTAQKPILIHCQAGADRTGLAAAIYLAATGHEEADAEAQLSWKFGHLGIPILSKTHAMDTTFERLEPWLGFPRS